MAAARILIPVLLLLSAGSPTEVLMKTSDQIAVYGDLYETGSARPLILLVHQGDGDARGEYAPIIPRLRDAGFDILAIDSRLGGGLFGVNRTVDRNPIRDWKYCDAYPDLVAALDFAKARAKEQKVIVWGSSYSATLALRLAAERPGDVAAVLAFSPASGPAMGDCQPVAYAARVKVPVLVVRPRKELDEAFRREDFETFKKQGHETWIADPGAHGSSTLVADRAGGDVSATWSAVLGFLEKIKAPPRAAGLAGERVVALSRKNDMLARNRKSVIWVKKGPEGGTSPPCPRWLMRSSWISSRIAPRSPPRSWPRCSAPPFPPIPTRGWLPAT